MRGATTEYLAGAREALSSDYMCADGGLISTARRLGYSTSDGSAEGPPLLRVNLDFLERAAQCLGVTVAELFVGPGVRGNRRDLLKQQLSSVSLGNFDVATTLS